MDSFYGAPRQPPIPTAINLTPQVPVVPEVSVIENPYNDHHTRFSCNLAAKQSHTACLQRDSFIGAPPFANRKHVRFKNPSGSSTVVLNKENLPQSCKSVPDLNGKTFKQIYMANVPDRHLDLSIFEPALTKEKQATDTIKHPALDMLHSKSPFASQEVASFQKTFRSPVMDVPKFDNPRLCSSIFKSSSEIATLKSIENLPYSKPMEVTTTTDEPTVKDLYKIIQQQNEQILMLQRQISNLKMSIRQPEPEPLLTDYPQERNIPNSPAKKGLFSIDLKATSFEVSLRPQHKFHKQNDFVEPRIREVIECDVVDTSLRLDDSLSVKDSYVSAEPSIQIHMDDYKSSDDEDTTVQPGPTFYKNVMDQINNILKNVKVQSECQQQEITGQVRKQVKQATLQHLRSIGVNLSPIQECAEISAGSDVDTKTLDQSEISFAVKQLLMKYLPDDKLTQSLDKQKKQTKRCVSNENKYKVPASEFSFATVQYLKKYNIIDNCRKLAELERKTGEDTTPKILDVTALKQQPKLL